VPLVKSIPFVRDRVEEIDTWIYSLREFVVVEALYIE
jgi:hypothetical protein